MAIVRRAIVGLCALLAVLLPAAAATSTPPVRHVFVVVLENENAAATFGPASPAPYLSRTLRGRGAFIPEYYGVTHLSLGNYVALISGQGSNPQIQADCQAFSPFIGIAGGPDGQAVGDGCVYPATVMTIADQLRAHGLTWKAYMEDMGNDPVRESATCGHPAIGALDPTQTAEPGDQYAVRHNPFVYFHSIIDTPACGANDVPLSRLPGDLRSARTTANLTFITPNLCNDGHDSPCVDGRPGGLATADSWLREWVPRIVGSPAFRRDGLLLITFDEASSSGASADASACCNEPQFPGTPNNGGTVPGRGGGRVGAVVLSPFVRAGTVTSHPYNHFSALRTFERLLGLGYLGYANSPDPGSFGADVFTAR